LPELGLGALSFIVLLLDLRWTEAQRKNIAVVSALGLGLLAIITLILTPDVIKMVATQANPNISPDALKSMSFWGGMIRYDALTHIFQVMVLAAGAITSLISADVKGIGRKGEFYIILIVSSLGMVLMAGASDLIMAFLALETTSIPLYILAGFKRGDNKSMESGMKYFLFGSFASAMMLYGLSLLYGFSGQTNLYQLAQYLTTDAFSAIRFQSWPPWC